MIPHGIETPEQRRKRRWKERLLRWQKKLGPEGVKAYNREYLRKWNLENVDKKRAHRKQWIANNIEKVRAYRNRKSKRKYIRCRESILSKKKEYYKRNRSRLLEMAKKRYSKTREKRLAYLKSWQKSNRGKLLDYNTARRIKKATKNLSEIREFVSRVKLRINVRCYYCDNLIPSKGCHFDHIIPLARGGQHSADNLCVSCRPCNLRKHTRFLSELNFMGQQLFPL